jgi:aminopeptidase N
MFRHVAAFEFRYQLGSPVFVLGCVLFFLMAFGATVSDNIHIGGPSSAHVNSPWSILQTLGVMNVIGIFLYTAFVAGAVIRDEETGFAPLLRATRIGKRDYVLGRFAGSSAVAFLALAMVPAGILIGSWMPWVDPETLGPLVPWHYVYALLVFGLPTLLLISALFFALATLTRSLMWTYVGAVLTLILFLVSRSYLRDQSLDAVSALSDPFGVAALTQITKYWTVTERNTLLPALEGRLLWNRLLWGAIAAALLGLAYALFRMQPRDRAGSGLESFLRASRLGGRSSAGAVEQGGSPVTREGGGETRPAAAGGRQDSRPDPTGSIGWTQFLAIARFDAVGVIRSPAFFVLLALGVLNNIGNMRFASQLYGIEVYPVTRAMVLALQGSFEVIPLIIAIFYAGELVWRDRQYRMHEIVDATAAPDWAQLLPKIGAIVAVLVLSTLIAVASAMGFQLAKGYTVLEPGRYLLWWVLPATIGMAQVAALAVFVQAIVPHKMIGWGVMVAYVVGSISLVGLGYEHNLYNYGGVPQVPLSDMNGMGHFWIGRAWFHAYWSAFALLLVVAALWLRTRGTEQRLAPRLARIGSRLRSPSGAVAAIALLAWVVLGSWMFWNTNVLNAYRTQDDRDQRLADYEKTVLPFETVPQPRIVDVELDVELYPHERRVTTRGAYLVENHTDAPVSTLHLAWPVDELALDEVGFDGARLDRELPGFGYRIYALEPALAPGERRRLAFASTRHDRGFHNDAGQHRVVDNGTFLNDSEIAPSIGPSREGLLKDRAKRRKHGLAPELRMARLEDEAARAHHYLRRDSDQVTVRVRFTTDADQVPLAPGDVVSDTVEGGRRTLVTRAERPIGHAISLQSARYEVARRQHGEVALSVHYQPGHEYNVERMLDAMETSLDTFSAAFAPYQYRHARVLEFPAYEDFAQAFAGTMPYSEGIGFIMNPDLDREIDMVTYVTAHEVAHQWWGYQLIGADMQGSTMLSETFAQYSALLVMEKLRGKEQIRRFLKYELDRYLRGRGEELVEELPLARVENQPYIHYRKGSLAMYWLKEVVGEAVVNRALRRFLAAYANRGAPYPRTTEFLAILREEAGPQHDALITDLFERITLLDARTLAAEASRRGDGKWELRLSVEARKLVADGKGVETEEPLDEPIEIGVFTEEPGDKDFDAGSVLLFERRPVRSGTQEWTLVLDREPVWAGIDPYNKRIDRNAEDNLKKVTPPAKQPPVLAM